MRGRVVDASSQRPIQGATIVVFRASRGDSVARGLSDTDGGFRIERLAVGQYRLRVRALGFAPRELPLVTLSPSRLLADVGAVALNASAIELQSQVITTRQPDVQLAPDRNTYVVRDMPTTRGGTALDVLRNVPSVDVDIDNVVSLRGNAGVIVQINGRRSPLKSAQLGNFLAQLPAEMVEKIEVIPNPSARDDPEGVAGIINIVLKKEADAGTSGGITFGGGTTGHADIGGNLGYQRKALTLFGSYGFLRDNRPRTESLFRENLFRDPLTFLQENGVRTQIPLAHSMTGSAEYKLSARDELSLELLYTTRVEAETNSIFYRDLDASRLLTAFSDRLSRNTNHESEFESTIGYQHNFAGKRHRLSSEFRVVRASEGGPFQIAAHTLSAAGDPVDITAQERQTSWERPDEGSIKVDYQRPLSKHERLEAGYKGSLQHFHTTLDTRVFDAASQGYEPDSTRISDFTYDQLVNAAYAQGVSQRGKFVMQGGLRVERATTQFTLRGRNASFDNNYSSVFPSALIAYNVDETHQIKLSYSTRIRRPDETDQLDPTPRYADPLNIFRGNPYLKPEYIRALELGVQRSQEHLTFQFTPFLRHTLDAVRGLRSIDSAGVATRTFANVATTDAYGADATVSRSGGRLSGFAGASFFRQVSNASNLDAALSARTFGWTARTNASFRATKSLDVQSLLFYRGATTVEQGRNGAQTRFSIAARQKLMDDQLGVTLRIIDPFRTSHETNTTIDPRFTQVSNRARAIRGLLLSVNWTFGKPLDDREPIEPPGGGP